MGDFLVRTLFRYTVYGGYKLWKHYDNTHPPAPAPPMKFMDYVLAPFLMIGALCVAVLSLCAAIALPLLIVWLAINGYLGITVVLAVIAAVIYVRWKK
ncbi:MAG TPA: hypothetical protein VE377_07670 [Candidatus Dormibacteraeota bacterium]|nr:hypothetical protein [Candidatus Dormibacteraeota bacterium]